MSENSAIEWTDHTFNPWMGCTKVSPGCLNCYAEKLDKRHLRSKDDHWGKNVPRLPASEATWKAPAKWNRDMELFPMFCPMCGGHEGGRLEGDGKDICQPCSDDGDEVRLLPRPRPKVFCASLADWLDEEVPVEWLARLLGVIHATPALDWLLLTKRPENFERRLFAAMLLAEKFDPADKEPYREGTFSHWLEGWKNGSQTPANVWIGTSVEDQARGDERIPRLLEIPAKVRFLSCEPLLGKVDLREWQMADGRSIDWVICGGESGRGARPMHPDWARGLRDQCAAAGVAFFFKQWGEWLGYFQPADADEVVRACMDNPRGRWVGPDGETTHKGWNTVWMNRVGKKSAGRLLDGREHNEMPQPHLRVVGSRDFGAAVVVRDERDGSEQIVRTGDLPGGIAQ